MERATDVGIDGYITKPFRIAQVLAVVESYLQRVAPAGARRRVWRRRAGAGAGRGVAFT